VAYFHGRADKSCGTRGKFAPFPDHESSPDPDFALYDPCLKRKLIPDVEENRERSWENDTELTKVWCMIDMFDVVLPIFMVKSY